MPLPPDVADPIPGSELTSREVDVLAALARGLDTAAIAEELGLSPRTVRNYLSRTYDKLHVRNRVQASLWARDHLHPVH